VAIVVSSAHGDIFLFAAPAHEKNKNNQQDNYNQHEVENAGEKLGHLDLRTEP
jgi:hypothetical protein